MASADFHTMVDCIDNGAPHGEAARHFLGCVAHFPESIDTHYIRCAVTWELFQRTEALLERTGFDISEFAEILYELGERMVANWKRQAEFNHKLDFSETAAAPEDFRSATQEHYGNLFRKFSEKHYFEEAAELLAIRLQRSSIDLGDVSGAHALDAGCGGGRYSHALKRLGFGHVTGLDFSPLNIETANERMKLRDIRGLEFRVGNVLDLPFADGTFDFVFSNGVLHHTESIVTGLKEIRRVLKPEGKAWLYVIERPGGLHWDMVELLRNVMRPVSRDYARALFSLLGVPGNRIFYILDHIMVPINTRSTIEEIESLCREAGFGSLKRLSRGADFDRIEQLHRKSLSGVTKDLLWKYGVGEHRYILDSRQERRE